MIKQLNAIAMMIGYGAICFSFLWFCAGLRKKIFWKSRLREAAERWHRFQLNDPHGWAAARSIWDQRKARNDVRREEINRLVREMEPEFTLKN